MQNKKYQWDLGNYGTIEYAAVVVNKYSKEKIQKVVDYLLANQNLDIKNPAGWIIKAIENNYKLPIAEDTPVYTGVPNVEGTSKKLAKYNEHDAKVKKQQNTPRYKEEQEKLFALGHKIENKMKRDKRSKPSRLTDDELFPGRADFVRNYLKENYKTTSTD